MRTSWFGMGMIVVGFVGCGDDDTGEVDVAGDTLTVQFDTSTSETTVFTPDTATEPSDTAVTDTALGDVSDVGVDIEPGTFGASCDENVNCQSGYCVEGPEGFVCTRLCQTECPAGYDCKGVAGRTDVAFLCLPRLDRLCAPCTEDLQCNGGKCLDIDGEQRCGRPCARTEDCPSGFTCVPDGEAINDGYCQPDTLSCTCFAEVDGGLRTCATSNALGQCLGVSDCDQELGWSACSAKVPSAETCNGQDDDCDAFVDEELAEVGAACTIDVAGVGSCAGQTVCAGVGGIQCQGPTPEAETCDFADEDCDGAVDEDFKQGTVYATFEHCGTCNRSCAIGFPNALQTSCQIQQGVAQCVVVSCEPGYIKQNDFQCIPDVVNLCEPCSSDANCLGQGSACVTLPDGQFCAKACTGNQDCPLGFECESVGEPSNQCVPTTGVCSCGPSTQGLSRACAVTVSPAGQPSYTCAGTETCGAAGWGACAMPVEACNSIDDDCDATTDEGFRNAQGRYDQVENCGACGVSCLALDFPNSSPRCDSSGAGLPQCGYQCDGNWVDIDLAPGCDCLPSSTIDLPDPNGVDANCDGIDGELSKAVFVAKTGNDAGLGTIDDPLRTIQAGVARAQAQTKRDVLVATGVYEESVVLANAVSVYGGYSPDFSERDFDVHETAILGAVPTDALRGAVNATGLATTTGQALTFDGFSVFGANNPATSGNSYAIYLRNVGPNITVSNNYVVAGDGGVGASGTKGTDGGAGVNGAPGIGAKKLADDTCDTSDESAGGGGGAKTCGATNVGGGTGGTSVCPSAPTAVNTAPQTPLPREYGLPGQTSGGAGGEPGWDQRVNASCGSVGASNTHDSFGADGGAGSNGINGAAGSACIATNGTITDGHWVGPDGGTAGSAEHGRGGGGGGAGGGVDTHVCDSTNASYLPVVSGSGGGGGSGGCRGEAGTFGRSGGGSFAIFVAFNAAPTALPTIRDNLIVRGRGGSGGQGGAGGVAGSGGIGGTRGPSNRGTDNSGFSIPLNCCASAGGNGGAGGRGGQGAGGVGGCGGASFGLYIAPNALSAPRTNITANTFLDSGAGGAGGAGGTSLGNLGAGGGTGLRANTNY